MGELQGIKVKKGLFPSAASGRAIATGRDDGVTKPLFDDSPGGQGKTMGSGMLGELALAVEWAQTRRISARKFTRIRR